MVGKMLVEFDSTYLAELLTWVNSQDQLREWAGPNVRYPCTAQTLKHDLFSKGWPSYALVSASHDLLGFGQYYSRLKRCHLCRLIVAPSQRGQGIAQELIDGISNAARRSSMLESSSLFVYESNLAAIKAYQKIGFKLIDYPAEDRMENCLYMIKS